MSLFVVALATLLTAVPALAQDRLTQLSLDDALRLALAANPTLKAKEAELRSVRANEITAALRKNPTASYTVEQLGGKGTEPEHTISVGQPIETGGKRRRRIDAARAATVVIGHQLVDVKRQIILQVKKAFIDALVAREQLALARQTLTTLDQTERLQRLRVERGDLSQLELLRIEVQRFTFERDVADARQALDAARIQLRAVTGTNGVAPDVDIVGELRFEALALTRDDLLRIAREHRPDFKATEADRARARADYELARANAWWDVMPQISYQRVGPDNTFGVGIGIDLRIFDRNQGEIAKTRAEIDRVAAVAGATELQILAEVDTALTAVMTQRDRVVALRDTYLPKAQRARDVVEYAYRQGAASLLDFLDAQRSHRETAIQYLQALGAYATAVAELEAHVGRELSGMP